MPPDPDRLTAALAALGGGALWALCQFSTKLLTGQPLQRQEAIAVLATVAIGVAAGVVAAYFLAPALAELVPLASLRDLHAVGFGIGAAAWEVTPFAYRWLRRAAERKAGEGSR